jgi:hypothetical protein
MNRLVHTGLGSSSLVAHVPQYPPPPHANNFVLGPAIINTHTTGILAIPDLGGGLEVRCGCHSEEWHVLRSGPRGARVARPLGRHHDQARVSLYICSLQKYLTKRVTGKCVYFLNK